MTFLSNGPWRLLYRARRPAISQLLTSVAAALVAAFATTALSEPVLATPANPAAADVSRPGTAAGDAQPAASGATHDHPVHADGDHADHAAHTHDERAIRDTTAGSASDPNARDEHASSEDAHDTSHDEHAHAHDEDAHAGHDDHGQQGEAPGAVRLSPAQRQALKLRTLVLELRPLAATIRAPGEVRANAYATSRVTPRIAAQVVARHARLGDQVPAGQPLVTLSSPDMADAQGDFVVAEREWQRLRQLKGDNFVSEREHLQARVSREKALWRVLAFGMTRAQADALVAAESGTADGTFDLLAPSGGTLVADDFVLGELVEPGRMLFEISDEAVRWVEARLPPEEAARVAINDAARVADGEVRLDGQVVQIHHLLDEATRTRGVRIAVPDPGHRLHPGTFVDVTLLAEPGEPVLAVPETAVLRAPDGDWQVFVAEDEATFRPVEVVPLRTADGMTAISGLPAGTRVVTQGAFFLQSELAKGGFDPHNH
jgi:RND family efflux transporter MFP subunit